MNDAIIIFIVFLFILQVIIKTIEMQRESVIRVVAVTGFLVGVVHDVEVQDVVNEDDESQVIGWRNFHTLQIGLLFILLNFNWATKIKTIQ